jgi:N-acylneuraminate cytidylyltransferase
MLNSQILGIIPARGGSKIPRSVRLLAGKPLLAHSILHLQQSGKVGRVAVSTDATKKSPQ